MFPSGTLLFYTEHIVCSKMSNCGCQNTIYRTVLQSFQEKMFRWVFWSGTLIYSIGVTICDVEVTPPPPPPLVSSLFQPISYLLRPTFLWPLGIWSCEKNLYIHISGSTQLSVTATLVRFMWNGKGPYLQVLDRKMEPVVECSSWWWVLFTFQIS